MACRSSSRSPAPSCAPSSAISPSGRMGCPGCSSRSVASRSMHERIAAHPWPRGGVEVLRANRGYTLYSRRTGGPVARLRPTGKADNGQVLGWRREAWATPGDFGLLTLPLDEAVDFVATEGFFWINA